MTTFIIAALTADGFIGRDAAHKSTRWTSKQDAVYFREKTKDAGVMIMGRTTYETIGKPLPDRLNIVMSRSAPASLEPVVAESGSNAQADSANENLIFTSLPPTELLTELAAKEHSYVAICGGASVYTQFLAAGLVDKLYLTIEPVIFGDGVRLFNKAFESPPQIKLAQVHDISEQTKVLEYIVEKKC